MELSYTKIGDFLYPNLLVPPDSKEPLGKYARMRRAFLMENRQPTFDYLAWTGQLFPHLREVDEAAKRRMETIMSELLKANPAPDKATNQLGWVQHMNSLQAQAEEVVLAELVYV